MDHKRPFNEVEGASGDDTHTPFPMSFRVHLRYHLRYPKQRAGFLKLLKSLQLRACVVLTLVCTSFWLTYPLAARFHGARHTGTTLLRPGLTPRCNGAFTFRVGSSLTAEVLDATFDSRPLIEAAFRTRHPHVPVFRHVLVQFAAEEGLVPASNGTKTVSAALRDRRVRVAVKYVSLVRCSRRIGYKKSWRTCLWSAVLALWPAESLSRSQFDHLLRARGAALHLAIPLEVTPMVAAIEPTYAAMPAVVTIRPSVALACLASDVDTSEPKNALMILGSPVSGTKLGVAGAREAAHFAFRALTGLLTFRTVAVAFQPRKPLSAIGSECRGARRCIARELRRNTCDVRRYRRTMEAELRALGLPRRRMRSVVVGEYCRLGDCGRLRAHSQVGWGELAAARLARAHRWAGALDLDELLGRDPAAPGPLFRPSADAARFLDTASGGASTVKLEWFYTILASAADGPRLSRALADSTRVHVFGRDRNGAPMRRLPRCRQWQGKSFGRCAALVRAHVHNAVVVDDARTLADVLNTASDLNTGFKFAHTALSNSSVRVWHARHHRKRKGAFCALSVAELT